MTREQHARASQINDEIHDILDLESTLKHRITINFGHIPCEMQDKMIDAIDSYYSGCIAKLLIEYDAL